MEKRNLLSEIGRSMLCLSLYCHHNNINKLERQLIWPRWNQEDARIMDEKVITASKVNNWSRIEKRKVLQVKLESGS